MSGVRARGFHGVFPEERREGQDFIVDVEVQIERQSAEDDLETTVDYGGLAEALVADIEGEPVNLIETLASRLLCTCLAAPPVRAATVHSARNPRHPFGSRLRM
ncbi:dihydroneopterin aldolase [Propioniciclava flava]